MKEEQLQEVFSKFGTLVRFRLYAKATMGFDGFLGEGGVFYLQSHAKYLFCSEFCSAEVAERLVNTLVKVGDCELHCSLPWESLTSQPVPHQILLESRSVQTFVS